ncbi:MAG: hypothetical protein NTY23_13050 [Chloroflexi bacterium]|nr:hypothetical protein [Chloroflexota bacterium]
MKRPLALWLMIFFLALLALGGFYGGLSMLSDPSGNSLQMAEVLPLLRVPDYLLPGLFLVSVMGALPLLLIYALLARPTWPWLDRLFTWSRHYWAWTTSLGLGLVLGLWLAVQTALIGFRWPIQYITAMNGLLIIALALVPSVQKHHRQGPR